MSAKSKISSLETTPLIQEVVYQNIPGFLKECCSYFSNERERDAVFTSLLMVLSGMMPTVSGRYGKLRYYPMMYGVICAPAASGKGSVAFARYLAEPYNQLFNAIKTQTEDDENKDVPIISFIMPADSSAAMFLSILKNNGGRGMLFETEIDPLTNSVNQEWGTYDVNLRLATHHETISYARKKDNINIVIEKPMLAMLLAGTPGQLGKLLPSTENGLFSRITFYCFYRDASWESQNPDYEQEDLQTIFKSKGERLLVFLKELEKKNYDFRFTKAQWEQFDNYFKEVMEDFSLTHGDDARAVVSRLGLIVFRIAMVLSVMRMMDTNATDEIIICGDVDFGNAVNLGKVYLAHAKAMIEMTPESTAIPALKQITAFYQGLPLSFSRADAVKIGANLKISERTVGRYLRHFITHSYLSQPKMGQYSKPV